MRRWAAGLLLAYSAAYSAAAGAGDWGLIVTGATWHAGDGPARRQELNPWQHTAGVEYDGAGGWFAQVSTMTDSYYCRSRELVAGRRWGWMGGAGWSAGGFAGTAWLDRCGEAMEGQQQPVRVHLITPLTGVYGSLGRWRVDALLLPTLPGKYLHHDTPLVYLQLSVSLGGG